MLKLLVITDDFTGALDTGVQFAKRGITTAVHAGILSLSQIPADIQVAVVDTESRHLSPGEAYDRVYALARDAKLAGIPHCYKKVDSTLRGNIGSELAAAIDGYGQEVMLFAPAFPKVGRTTREGVQYLDGVPIADTVFAKDPFEPVTCSSIPDIIAQQSALPVHVVQRGMSAPQEGGPYILVFDWEKDKDFEQNLPVFSGARLMAGSAGLAEYLPRMISFETGEWVEISGTAKVLFISGSVNPITIGQMEKARDSGLPVFWLTGLENYDAAHPSWTGDMETLLEEAMAALERQGVAVLSINALGADVAAIGEEHRQRVCRNLGHVVERLMKKAANYTLVVFGGDTAMEVLNRLGGGMIRPLREITPGVVLSKALNQEGNRFLFVTKSGGFGKEDVVLRILEDLRGGKAGLQEQEVLEDAK